MGKENACKEWNCIISVASKVGATAPLGAVKQKWVIGRRCSRNGQLGRRCSRNGRQFPTAK